MRLGFLRDARRPPGDSTVHGGGNRGLHRRNSNGSWTCPHFAVKRNAFEHQRKVSRYWELYVLHRSEAISVTHLKRSSVSSDDIYVHLGRHVLPWTCFILRILLSRGCVHWLLLWSLPWMLINGCIWASTGTDRADEKIKWSKRKPLNAEYLCEDLQRRTWRREIYYF